jgi:hypothetical protein
MLTRMLVSRAQSDLRGQCSGALEACWVAEFGDEHGRGIIADTSDVGQKLADLMLLKLGGDIAIEPLKPLAQGLEVLAGVTHTNLMRRAVLAHDRVLGGIDQLPCEVLTDHVASIVTELGQTFVRDPAASSCRRILMQDGGGKSGVKVLSGTREHAEAEKAALGDYLRQNTGLELSEEKTRISDLTEGFESLAIGYV